MKDIRERGYPGAGATRLQERPLMVARLAALAVVILTMGMLLPLLPAYMSYLSTVCHTATCPVGQLTPATVHALLKVGLSIHTVVVYTLVLTLISLLMCWSVAAVIFWHKSDDWMALTVACMLVLMGTSYITHVLLQFPSPWQTQAMLLDILTFAAFFLVFCLFPNGRFVPSWLHWLPIGWIVWGLFTLLLLAMPGFFSLHLVGFLIALATVVITQVYRYRYVSSLLERQQTKWVVWGGSMAILAVLAVSLPEALIPTLTHQGWLYGLLDAPTLTIALFFGALSIGMAILRSRLWDIDILINRTLVYGTLSVSLACIYAVLVITLQFTLQRLFIQANDVALVTSTLAIAAIFYPLRRRIQQHIDRRFYRSKYDAAQAVAAFGVRLRRCNTIEVATLTNELLAAVEETMQPVHASLWLRPSQPPKQQATRALPRIDE